MEEFIQPYQYNLIENQAQALANAYRSVNDQGVVKTIKAVAMEKIQEEFLNATPEQKELLQEFANLEKEQRKVDNYLAALKEKVIPFEQPTDGKLKKLFAKTKKLSLPNWEEISLKNMTFYGWNDVGQQRKYIVLYAGGKLVGVQGVLSPTIHKGVCAICQTTSEVVMLTVKGKTTKDGLYKSRGNYICYHSERCNHQIQQVDKLHQFIETVTAK